MFRSLDLWISSVYERYMMSGGIPSSTPKDAVGETSMDKSEEEEDIIVGGEEGRREAEEEGDTDEERAMAAAVAPLSS